MESTQIEQIHENIQHEIIAFENQRWIPLFGWSGMMLPQNVYNFSDKNGTTELNKDDYIDNNNIWEYASDFNSLFTPICTSTCYVRRKKWNKSNNTINNIEKNTCALIITNDDSLKEIENHPIIMEDINISIKETVVNNVCDDEKVKCVKKHRHNRHKKNKHKND